MQKANKGEWSEFYVLLKLIGEGKLSLADKNLNADGKHHYVILKVFRDEKIGRITYDLTKKQNLISIIDYKKQVIGKINQKKVASQIPSVFKAIKDNGNKTFSNDQLALLLNELHCKQIQAGSEKKIDLSALVNDKNSVIQPPELGFSIKSMLSAPSTLLNASKSTNFIYIIKGLPKEKIEKINSIKTNSKIKDRLKEILNQGGEIVFEKMDSPTFDTNLKKIDSQFANLMSSIILDFYLGKGTQLTDLVKINLIKFKNMEVKYLVKRFLGAVALGMFPNKKWDGLIIVNGGYILVKKDGEIVCFHLFNEEIFRNYLLSNVKLETPSSSRHKFGIIFEKENQTKIKLNLQIRFIR